MKQIRKYSVYLILPLLLTFLTAFCCYDDIGPYECAKLINQSEEIIYFSDRSYNKEYESPIDSKFIFDEIRYRRYQFKDIDINGTDTLLVEEGEYLSIIIFKESTFTKYSVQELIDSNYCDKYYNYSYDELKAMNFTITYTGE